MDLKRLTANLRASALMENLEKSGTWQQFQRRGLLLQANELTD
jgi:hypothetical protein